MPAGCRRRPRCLAALAALALAVGMAAANADETPAEAQRKVDIAEYVVRGNSVLDARAIEEAEAYQSRGYQSVYVELPEQQVADGVVYLQVSETKVGRVRVVGAKHYSPLEVREEVPALAEGAVPNFEQVQSQLADLNRTPGRQVVPLVREGQRPGTMGRRPQGRGQEALARQPGPEQRPQRRHQGSALGGLHRSRQPLAGRPPGLADPGSPHRRSAMTPNGYKSDSDVATVGGTNVVGRGHSYGLALTYSLPPSAKLVPCPEPGRRLQGLRGTRGPRRQRRPRAAQVRAADLLLHRLPLHRKRPDQPRPEPGGWHSQLPRLRQRRRRLRLQTLPGRLQLRGAEGRPEPHRIFSGDWQAGAKAAFQLASGPLVSNEQFSAGGATSVRGYLAAEATGDDGAALSLEARTPSLSGWLGKGASQYLEEWRFYLFADGAHLRVQDTQAEQQDDFTLASVGIGTRMRLGEWLSGSVDWGAAAA
ncbi:hypothetical protein L1887_46954 [Cichorium endivia]|nr:hypothetical protein L1887_46954 [Cichorium endivia]